MKIKTKPDIHVRACRMGWPKGIYLIICLVGAIFWSPLNAQKEIELRNDGILFPRLDSNSISAPVVGLVFYDTTSSQLTYYDGFDWKTINGAFERYGATVRQKTGINSDDFIFGRLALPQNGEIVEDTLFFFDQSKGAFRGGFINQTDWSPDSLGPYSFAYGFNPKASERYGISLGYYPQSLGEKGSIAIGYLTYASGPYGSTAIGHSTKARGNGGATAIGSFAEANGDYGSTALGRGTMATGDFGATSLGYDSEATGSEGATAIGSRTKAAGDNGATSLGFHTTANGNSCTVVGLYNDTLVTATNPISSTSPIFIIGNGDSGTGNESNALVVRKDGNIGIGNTNPGVKFKVGNGGDGTIARANAWDLFSDQRFKEDIVDLENSLEKVLNLRGRSFIWKASGKEDIGFVAQEVEQVVSHLVTTDAAGYKSMDYGKVVPLLVEAIKVLTDEVRGHEKKMVEQQKQINELNSLLFH